MMRNTYKIEQERLEKTGKLTTHPHISCTKCATKVTAFGTNLAGKIKKAGSLETLLSHFECRGCRGTTARANKPRLPKALRKTRVSKAAAIAEHTAELVRNPPTMIFAPRKPLLLLKHPELAADVTLNSCVRPDVFLDSDRCCDQCALYKVCKAPCRSLSKFFTAA